jgi:hypothetical protein
MKNQIGIFTEAIHYLSAVDDFDGQLWGSNLRRHPAVKLSRLTDRKA